jgi:hypothetical protein
MSVYFFLTGRSKPICRQKWIRQVVFKKKKKFEIYKKTQHFPLRHSDFTKAQRYFISAVQATEISLDV